ncbi:MAG TPA: 5'-nucleotidase, partial [Bacteroidia bacterium]|nr:5'-nucleotidase [Bacteroidia bacterium]
KSEEVFYIPGKPTEVVSDSTIISEITPYKIKLDEIMNEVISVSDHFMEKGQPESILGNFVSDVCFFKANDIRAIHKMEPVDFCVLNNGGLRSSLPAGKITLKNVYELMPFENELVVVKLRGSTVEKLLDYIAAKGGVPDSNLKMKITGTTFSEVFVGDKKFNSESSYLVLTSDYLATGGDAMTMFEESLSSEATGVKVRDAIIEFMKSKQQKGEILNAVTDGRISR